MRAVLMSALKYSTALILDLYTSFVGFGYVVGYITGALTDDGIQLSAIGAAATFALMAVYFFISMKRGGTPWQRIVGMQGPAISA